MDEENKKEQGNKGEEQDMLESAAESHQHVHIFGAEVDGGVNSGAGASNGESATKATSQTKEDWRQKRREQKEQWRMQRHEWRQTHRHEGGMFWGLILLLVGVLALMDTMGYVSPVFWHAIVPFWPILLILWGASLVLGRHWFTRFILFIFALIFIVIVIIYGLIRAGSPLVSYLSPNVVRAVEVAQPQQ